MSASVVAFVLISAPAQAPLQPEGSAEPGSVEAAEPTVEAPDAPVVDDAAPPESTVEAVETAEPAPGANDATPSEAVVASPEPAPETAPPDPAPVPSFESAPAPTPAPTPPPSGPSLDRPARRGTLFGVSTGYVGCITASCRSLTAGTGWRFPGGAFGQLEFGVRAGRIAPSVSVAMGGGPMRYSGDLEGYEGTMRMLDVGAGLLVYPLAKGRWDPFAGLRFGYARVRDHFEVPGEDLEGDIIYSRYGLRFSAGLGYYVLPMLSVGPRFDLTMPVSGSVCGGAREGDVSNTQCFDASSFSAYDRARFPRWWTLSAMVQLVLPRRGMRGTSTSRAR